MNIELNVMSSEVILVIPSMFFDMILNMFLETYILKHEFSTLMLFTNIQEDMLNSWKGEV